MNLKTTLTLSLCLFLMVVANVAMAQPLPPAPNPSEGAPIDGFASVLMIASVAYGGMKLRRSKD